MKPSRSNAAPDPNPTFDPTLTSPLVLTLTLTLGLTLEAAQHVAANKQNVRSPPAFVAPD